MIHRGAITGSIEQNCFHLAVCKQNQVTSNAPFHNPVCQYLTKKSTRNTEYQRRWIYWHRKKFPLWAEGKPIPFHFLSSITGSLWPYGRLVQDMQIVGKNPVKRKANTLKIAFRCEQTGCQKAFLSFLLLDGKWKVRCLVSIPPSKSSLQENFYIE